MITVHVLGILRHRPYKKRKDKENDSDEAAGMQTTKYLSQANWKGWIVKVKNSH